MARQAKLERLAQLLKLVEIISTQGRGDLARTQKASASIGADIENLRQLRTEISAHQTNIADIAFLGRGDAAMRAKERSLLQDHALAEVSRLEATSLARKAEQKRLIIEAILRQAS